MSYSKQLNSIKDNIKKQKIALSKLEKSIDNSVVKAVHLDILIIKARINLGHQETVAEVSLNILNTVRQVLSRNVNGVSRPVRTRD